MKRSPVTPKQLWTAFWLLLSLLAILFIADLNHTRSELIDEAQTRLDNGSYLLSRALSNEPVIDEATVVDILNHIRLGPFVQISILDTSFNIITTYPKTSELGTLSLTPEQLRRMGTSNHPHSTHLTTNEHGHRWMVKFHHIQDRPYIVLMAGSRSEALTPFMTRIWIYAFLWLMAFGISYLSLSIQLRLLRSETRFRSMIDNFEDIPIQGFTPDGIVVYWNKASTAMYGYTDEEMIGRQIQEIMQSPQNIEDLEKVARELTQRDGHIEPIRWTLQNKDHKPVEAVTYFTMLTDSDGVKEIFCLDVNVGPLVEAQNRIQDLLNEKEMILKEVHHRIKNNMNTIAGMLWLQSDTLKDKAAAQALLDAQGRIMNMMVLYNKLFRTANFTTLSVKEFIEDMVTHIRVTQDPSERIQLHLDIEDAQIDSKKLQTVGMMVNELMTNVYKYAFPLGAEGVASVSIRYPEPGLLHLEVKDSGKGLPESILNHTEDDGFGMMLIRMLAEQMGATYEMRNDKGASFSFRIPI